MAVQGRERSGTDQVSEAIATVTQMAASAAKVASNAVQIAADDVTNTTAAVGKTVGSAAQQFVEQGTETVGQRHTSQLRISAQSTMLLSQAHWRRAALGRVDVEKRSQRGRHAASDYPRNSCADCSPNYVDTCAECGRWSTHVTCEPLGRKSRVRAIFGTAGTQPPSCDGLSQCCGIRDSRV
jgi:gas vesicle protein